MKRLSSYDWYYRVISAAVVITAGIPLFFIAGVYKAFIGSMVGWGIGTGIAAIEQSFRQKRIYFHEGKLFLYNLLSNQFRILDRDHVVFLRHEFGGRWRLRYVEGDKKKGFFFRTKLPTDEFKLIASSFNIQSQEVPNETIPLNPTAKS